MRRLFCLQFNDPGLSVTATFTAGNRSLARKIADQPEVVQSAFGLEDFAGPLFQKGPSSKCAVTLWRQHSASSD
jgi:hypothetical protein